MEIFYLSIIRKISSKRDVFSFIRSASLSLHYMVHFTSIYSFLCCLYIVTFLDHCSLQRIHSLRDFSTSFEERNRKINNFTLAWYFQKILIMMQNSDKFFSRELFNYTKNFDMMILSADHHI